MVIGPEVMAFNTGAVGEETSMVSEGGRSSRDDDDQEELVE